MLLSRLLKIAFLIVSFTFGLQLIAQPPSASRGVTDRVSSFTMQQYALAVSDLSKALSGYDVELLGRYFGESIQISLPAKQGNFSKAQAKYVLKEFFTNYPPRSVELEHQSSILSNGEHVTFTYMSSRGKFETTILLRHDGESPLIETFGIVPKN